MSLEISFLKRPDASLAYRTAGQGQWLIFCHALATHQGLWNQQMEALASSFRVLSFDLRGHGLSPPPASNDYRFETQADDVIALMDHLGIHDAALSGISVGGEVAQMAAARYPERFRRLVLTSTACYTNPARATIWDQRIADARTLGMAGITETTAGRWFSPDFARRHPEWIAWCRRSIAATPIESYVGLARVIQTMDLRVATSSITCPTLVICGDQDHNTGPAVAQGLVELIDGACLEVLAGAGHFPNVEVPDQFNELLKEFVSIPTRQ